MLVPRSGKMSNLMKARRSGKRLYTGRIGTPKSVHIEIYAQLNVEYQGLTFDNGTIIVLIPTVQLRTRKNAEDDNTLRLFSGMISNNPDNHPAWEPKLKACCGSHGQIGYERPGSRENFTKSNRAVMREGQTTPEVVELPGTWPFQIVAESLKTALALLDNVIQIALINDHWKPNASAGTLTKDVRRKDGSSWPDSMSLCVAPRGSFDSSAAGLLYRFMQSHTFLRWDGGAAHLSSSDFDQADGLQFEMSTSGDAEGVLDRRERSMLLELFPDLVFNDDDAMEEDADESKRQRTA